MLSHDQLDLRVTASEHEPNRQSPGVKGRKINDIFPLIVCLNLKRRSDRRQQMQARFAANQIEEVVCFDAIDGTRLSIPDRWPSTPGAYGCLQSHVAIVEYARQLGVSSVLIFEDDVEFAEDFQNKLFALLEHLPANWQMFFFGAIELEDPLPVSPGITRITKAYSTFAYAIHQSLFEPFIQLNKGSQQLLDINSFILQQNHPCYCAHPYLAWVDSGYSDAQEKIENHWYLRESLVLFGQSANRLLEKTCVLIHLASNANQLALENLYFLLDYYCEYFQGYLSVCILEQGRHSRLDFTRVPKNSRHMLFSGNSTREQNFARAAGKLAKAFDYLVLSTNGIYLQPMDFRGNLQMCRRYQLASGFSRQIKLTGKDSQLLMENPDGKGLDLTCYQSGDKTNSEFYWRQVFVDKQFKADDCYFFIETKLYLSLCQHSLVKGKQAVIELCRQEQERPYYQAVNNALLLSS
ncbi:glycosyltransferase family 25 protein [Thalassomonas actiniarum]|uniref:Glycosyltransferase family 25 protein n=1 Tax=Thalassomonas actiniarum TaxID=485447 RepID=A0AAE9YWG6_9GAMM|nr:glycosyltransferase family 25 protein [Thalassomonas actiniarum]WDE01639.1 glycosyltransferase family 25 protein [Thalassomonas actiniarum]